MSVSNQAVTDSGGTHTEGSGSSAARSRLLRDFRLSLRHSYYRMVEALGLTGLQDLIHGSGSVRSLATCPVWLLGVRYESVDEGDTDAEQKVLQELVADFTSRVWMTYRRGFEPMGDTSLSNDVGWGCMLRSGQMLMAQALIAHRLGRGWRRTASGEADCQLAEILRLFWDRPGDAHPLSIHNLCLVGAAFGVVVGEWLGPSPLCKTLEAAAMLYPQLGLRIHVAADPGGGAPVLYSSEVLRLFAGDEKWSAGAEEQAAVSRDSATGEAPVGPGVMLLVPLVLGIGKVNPGYIPQLQALLELPHSLGLVGGRPSSSLYFVGHQADNLMFLDPHTVQQAVMGEGCESSYHCTQLRVMPAATIDPSLAVALYCRNAGEFGDLCSRLGQLEVAHRSSVLVSVRDAPPLWVNSPRECDTMSEEASSPQHSPNEDGWQLL